MTVRGKEYKIGVTDTTTIKDIINTLNMIDLKVSKIIFSGKKLPEDKTVKDYNLIYETKVFAM